MLTGEGQPRHTLATAAGAGLGPGRGLDGPAGLDGPECIENNGLEDAVKLAVCSCIKIDSQ